MPICVTATSRSWAQSSPSLRAQDSVGWPKVSLRRRYYRNPLTGGRRRCLTSWSRELAAGPGTPPCWARSHLQCPRGATRGVLTSPFILNRRQAPVSLCRGLHQQLPPALFWVSAFVHTQSGLPGHLRQVCLSTPAGGAPYLGTRALARPLYHGCPGAPSAAGAVPLRRPAAGSAPSKGADAQAAYDHCGNRGMVAAVLGGAPISSSTPPAGSKATSRSATRNCRSIASNQAGMMYAFLAGVGSELNGQAMDATARSGPASISDWRRRPSRREFPDRLFRSTRHNNSAEQWARKAVADMRSAPTPKGRKEAERSGRRRRSIMRLTRRARLHGAAQGVLPGSRSGGS